MTRRDIESILYLDMAIQRLKDELADMEKSIGLSAAPADGMPHSSTPGNPTARIAIELGTQIEKIKEAEAKAEKKKLEVMAWYNQLDDELIKSIIYYKFIKHLTWRDVAVKLGYGDHTSYFRIYERFWRTYEQAN